MENQLIFFFFFVEKWKFDVCIVSSRSRVLILQRAYIPLSLVTGLHLHRAHITNLVGEKRRVPKIRI